MGISTQRVKLDIGKQASMQVIGGKLEVKLEEMIDGNIDGR